MNIKHFKKEIKRFSKIRNEEVLNFLLLIFCYAICLQEKNINKNNLIKLIKNYDYTSLKQEINYHNLLKNFNHQDEIKILINKYYQAYEIAKTLSPIIFNINAIDEIDEIRNKNDQYSELFKRLDALNEYIISTLNFNYSLIIEIARNNLLEVINNATNR